MRLAVLAVIALLIGCEINLSNDLSAQVSGYPTTVKPGDRFEVIVDVLNGEDISVSVESPEGIAISESIGSSYVQLDVKVNNDAQAGAKEIVVLILSGGRRTSVLFGFEVMP